MLRSTCGRLPPWRPRRARAPYAVDVEKFGNVLGPPAADADEPVRAVAVGRHHHGAADEYLPRIAHGLKTGGHIDAVAVYVAVIFDDIAKIDADAQLERALVEAFLYGQRRINRFVDAGKHGEKAVSRRLDDAPAMAGNGRVNELIKNSAQLRVGGSLVFGHQQAVADDIGGHDCRELAFHQHLFLSGGPCTDYSTDT